ncbi:MAG: CopG family ribbon-helix-helix protein [Actinomycetota bacterium]
MKRSSKVLAVSVPPDSAKDFDRIAKEEGRNKSELFREMLRVYRIWREPSGSNPSNATSPRELGSKASPPRRTWSA